jgi:phage baseplate assembly protein W
MNGLSPKFPLRFDYAGGAYTLNKTYREMVKQNLKNLILTNPGERIMDMNFGAGLRTYFFESMTHNTYPQIAADIEEQVKRYMPFVQIDSINFTAGDESAGTGNVLGVAVAYTILPLQEEDEIKIQESAEAF